MHRPRFSILVPVYNVQKYLEACVESILRQDFTDYEIILLNDGSTDQSGRMCDDFARRSPQITTFHQENAGLLQARRRLISRARGEFLLFVDSDDYLRTDALAVLDKAITQSDADMVIFMHNRVDPSGVVTIEQPVFQPDRVFDGDDKAALYEALIGTDRLNAIWRKAMRRELIESDIDYRPLGRMQQGEDLLQSLHPVDRARRVLYLGEALYFYRYNPQSITYSFDSKRWADLEQLTEAVERYAAKWKVPEAVLQAHYLRHTEAAIAWGIWAFTSSVPFKEQQQIVHSIREHPFVLKLIAKVDPRTATWHHRLLWTLFEKRQFTLLRIIVLAWNRVLRPVRSLIRRS
jgi:hypothetical protein